jgi:hypothetical protein
VSHTLLPRTWKKSAAEINGITKLQKREETGLKERKTTEDY